MKLVIIVGWFILMPLFCYAQSTNNKIIYQSHVQYVNNIKYKYTTFNNLSDNVVGLKVKGFLIQADAGIKDTIFYIAPGNPDDIQIFIYSVIGRDKKIFNQRNSSGSKQGIWVRRVSFGKVNSMFVYDGIGNLKFKIFIRENGFIKQILEYRDSKMIKYLTRNYNENGRVIGRRSKF